MNVFVERLVYLVLFFIILLVPLGLLLLANFGERRPTARILTIISIVGLGALLALLGMLSLLAPFAASMAEPSAATPATSFLIAFITAVVLLATAVGVVLPMVPQVRGVLARILPIRRDSIVDGVALSLAVALVGFSLASLPSAGNLGSASTAGDTAALMENAVTLPIIWLQGIMFAVYGFIGVGLWVRRSFRSAMERLGLGPLTPQYLAIAIGVFLALFLIDTFINLGWRALAPQAFEEFGRLTDSLFGPFTSIPGAITLGVSAGIGEEILFRGAAQPRLGLWLTSFLFAIAHVQYGLTPALIELFLVGLVLGYTRQRTNTTTTIVIHTLFNASTILLALYFPNWMS
ncbi:MAG: CPBP family intramembrane glutamic endopeptidase [Anaerolineae bacterium]